MKESPRKHLETNLKEKWLLFALTQAPVIFFNLSLPRALLSLFLSPSLPLDVKYVHNLSAASASEHLFCLFLKLISALREKICPFKNEIRLKGTFNLSGPESFISLEKWILSTHLSAYIKAEGTAV